MTDRSESCVEISTKALVDLVQTAEADDGGACPICCELLPGENNDNGDGEWLGHTSDCPVALIKETLEGLPKSKEEGRDSASQGDGPAPASTHRGTLPLVRSRGRPPGAVSFPTDNAPEGAGPDLELYFAGNLDWYVQVASADEEGLVTVSPAVRFCTDGSRNTSATNVIALLGAVLGGAPTDRIEALADGIVSMARLREASNG